MNVLDNVLPSVSPAASLSNDKMVATQKRAGLAQQENGLPGLSEFKEKVCYMGTTGLVDAYIELRTSGQEGLEQFYDALSEQANTVFDDPVPESMCNELGVRFDPTYRFFREYASKIISYCEDNGREATEGWAAPLKIKAGALRMFGEDEYMPIRKDIQELGDIVLGRASLSVKTVSAWDDRLDYLSQEIDRVLEGKGDLSGFEKNYVKDIRTALLSSRKLNNAAKEKDLRSAYLTYKRNKVLEGIDKVLGYDGRAAGLRKAPVEECMIVTDDMLVDADAEECMVVTDDMLVDADESLMELEIAMFNKKGPVYRVSDDMIIDAGDEMAKTGCEPPRPSPYSLTEADFVEVTDDVPAVEDMPDWLTPDAPMPVQALPVPDSHELQPEEMGSAVDYGILSVCRYPHTILSGCYNMIDLDGLDELVDEKSVFDLPPPEIRMNGPGERPSVLWQVGKELGSGYSYLFSGEDS